MRREAALEEQCSRTEARLNERLHDAEQRAANALHEDARHREKVTIYIISICLYLLQETIRILGGHIDRCKVVTCLIFTLSL